MKRFVPAALLVAVAACTMVTTPTNLPPHEDRVAWVLSRCWSCHRPGGEGPDFVTSGAPLSDGFYRMVAERPDLACHEDFTPPVADSRRLVSYLAALRDRRPVAMLPRPAVFPPRPAPDPELGRDLYLTHCATCHGETGRGDGPAAPFFESEGRPRAFRRGIYRSRSTPTLPTDEDLYSTITRGMPGSAMPPFSHLPEDVRWHLVGHLKSLAWIDAPDGGYNPFDREDRTPTPVGEPLPATPERLEAGRMYVESMDCRTCHGNDYRGLRREERGFDWTDEVGRPIARSADLVRGVFKSGSDPGDLYRSIFLGRGGSPMTVYGPLFHSEEKRWSIVHYVLSLRARE